MKFSTSISRKQLLSIQKHSDARLGKLIAHLKRNLKKNCRAQRRAALNSPASVFAPSRAHPLVPFSFSPPPVAVAPHVAQVDWQSLLSTISISNKATFRKVLHGAGVITSRGDKAYMCAKREANRCSTFTLRNALFMMRVRNGRMVLERDVAAALLLRMPTVTGMGMDVTGCIQSGVESDAYASCSLSKASCLRQFRCLARSKVHVARSAVALVNQEAKKHMREVLVKALVSMGHRHGKLLKECDVVDVLAPEARPRTRDVDTRSLQLIELAHI